MTRGTKSVLFGTHAFWLHPFCLAMAWTRLYGFPWDLRLWVAFFVHDLGYWGKKAMDDEEGENHPQLGAGIMSLFFGSDWWEFTILHSRYYSRKLDLPVSNLCYADKLAATYIPTWLYVMLGWASGEIWEYMDSSESKTHNPYEWAEAYKKWAVEWSLAQTGIIEERTAIKA